MINALGQRTILQGHQSLITNQFSILIRSSFVVSINFFTAPYAAPLHPGRSPSLSGLADERRFRIVLAEIFLDIFVGNPLDRPAPGPGSGVRPRIIHGHFVLQCIEIRS